MKRMMIIIQASLILLLVVAGGQAPARRRYLAPVLLTLHCLHRHHCPVAPTGLPHPGLLQGVVLSLLPVHPCQTKKSKCLPLLRWKLWKRGNGWLIIMQLDPFLLRCRTIRIRVWDRKWRHISFRLSFLVKSQTKHSGTKGKTIRRIRRKMVRKARRIKRGEITSRIRARKSYKRHQRQEFHLAQALHPQLRLGTFLFYLPDKTLIKQEPPTCPVLHLHRRQLLLALPRETHGPVVGRVCQLGYHHLLPLLLVPTTTTSNIRVGDAA
jgi:hypothetical protein